MTRSIVTCMHRYMPFGGEYFEPILDFYLQTMKKYQDEYDHLYLVDSNWNIDPAKLSGLNAIILKVNPNLRYYEAYKEVLPQIKEDLVLFMDNDCIIYKQGIIEITFNELNNWIAGIEVGNSDIVSIYDSCGTYKTDKLNGKNKFCPYWFATRKELLMKYLDVDWGPNLPEHETLGKLTEKMLDDGIKPYEWPEDKNSIYFDGTKDEESSKNTGVYHIRAGSVPACLLAWRDHRPDTYRDYLKNSPKREYLRQIMWFFLMCEKTGNSKIIDSIYEILENDLKIDFDWFDYRLNFIEYHGL